MNSILQFLAAGGSLPQEDQEAMRPPNAAQAAPTQNRSMSMEEILQESRRLQAEAELRAAQSRMAMDQQREKTPAQIQAEDRAERVKAHYGFDPNGKKTFWQKLRYGIGEGGRIVGEMGGNRSATSRISYDEAEAKRRQAISDAEGRYNKDAALAGSMRDDSRQFLDSLTRQTVAAQNAALQQRKASLATLLANHKMDVDEQKMYLAMQKAEVDGDLKTAQMKSLELENSIKAKTGGLTGEARNNAILAQSPNQGEVLSMEAQRAQIGPAARAAYATSQQGGMTQTMPATQDPTTGAINPGFSRRTPGPGATEARERGRQFLDRFQPANVPLTPAATRTNAVPMPSAPRGAQPMESDADFQASLERENPGLDMSTAGARVRPAAPRQAPAASPVQRQLGELENRNAASFSEAANVLESSLPALPVQASEKRAEALAASRAAASREAANWARTSRMFAAGQIGVGQETKAQLQQLLGNEASQREFAAWQSGQSGIITETLVQNSGKVVSEQEYKRYQKMMGIDSNAKGTQALLALNALRHMSSQIGHAKKIGLYSGTNGSAAANDTKLQSLMNQRVEVLGRILQDFEKGDKSQKVIRIELGPGKVIQVPRTQAGVALALEKYADLGSAIDKAFRGKKGQ